MSRDTMRPNLSLFDQRMFDLHREFREEAQGAQWCLHELILPMVLMGSIGAITWAIRGTDGWAGIDGTILPGMTWGLLWYYLCLRKGIDARSVPLWLGLGIAMGGELGYGQYVSWIRGMFNTPDEVIPISPWTGYLWFSLCGIGWGAPGGVLLGWALSRRNSLGIWLIRLLIPACVAYLGWLLVQWQPGWFFPHHEMGFYDGELSRHQDRTVYTNTQNFVVVAWWLGALIVATLQRDRMSRMSILVIGGGFGFGFLFSALWCHGYSYAPSLIDWWKMWELNAGFNLGVLYTLLLYWVIGRLEDCPTNREPPHPSSGQWWFETIGMSAGVFSIVAFMGADEFPKTGVFLGLMYVIPLFLASGTARDGIHFNLECRKEINLTYAIFLLMFILFWGVTSRTGVLLGLYEPSAVDQYAWPIARVALFAPFGVLIVGATLIRYCKIIWSHPSSDYTDFIRPRLPLYLVDLMALIGIVGAISIWPSKIGAFYAVFLALSLFAFNRINFHFDVIDHRE